MKYLASSKALCLLSKSRFLYSSRRKSHWFVRAIYSKLSWICGMGQRSGSVAARAVQLIAVINALLLA